MIFGLFAANCLGFLLHQAIAQLSSTEHPRPNVILITIDTLRADYLGCYGNPRIATPTLDALAADGALFERAYCQVPMTPPSHATILTGTYPPTHGVRDFTSAGLRPGFPTLASILKKNGYTTAAFVSAYVLDSNWGLNQGFDFYYDRFEPREFQGVNPGNVQRKAGETVGLALDWLKKGIGSPYLLWVHLYDPHHDYNPPEPYHTRYAKDLYGGEVAYVDHELGRFIAALKQRGDYENSLIVVTSDHGEAFGEHEESEHGFFVYNTTLHIPLIIKLPRGSGAPTRRVKGIVNTADIAPTVLQVTQLSADKQIPMQGNGLIPQMEGKPAPAQAASYSETLYPLKTFGWSDLASYTEGKFKYISAPRPELYDLVADPVEEHNLLTKERLLADRFRQRLEQFKLRTRLAVNESRSVADPQRVEALRSLGYIAVAGAPEKRAGQKGLVDPKDRVGLFNKILLALQAADAGVLGRSNSLLGEVIQAEPDLFVAHYSLGINSAKAGDNEKALEHFARAKSLNPSFDLTDISRATALARLGRLDEAVSILRDLLRHNPSRLEAKRQLGQLYTRKKDYAKAIETYQEILSGRPQDLQALKFLGINLVEAEQYEVGAASLNKALNLGVNDALLHNFLGIALGNLGQIADAVASYRRALSIKQDYQQARLNLSFALLKAGQSDEARKEFSILCQANPRLCEQYRKYFP